MPTRGVAPLAKVFPVLRRVPGALWGDDSSGSGAGVTPFSFAGNSDEASSRMSFSTSLSPRG